MTNETLNLRPSKWFYAENVQGDSNFHGNGPAVNVSAGLFVLDGDIYLRMFIDAIETKHDWTRGIGSRAYRVYESPHNKRIAKILGNTYASFAYIDDDHDIDIFDGSGFVDRWEIIGNTKDHDVGNDISDEDRLQDKVLDRTGFRVVFNPIEVELET